MSESKKYYKRLDIIRLIACIAVLLYHLGVLKGGYLAVCVFFVLSGYLSCVSAFKKEKFSILSYYSNRFKKIYLPLIIVTFITVAVISFFPNIFWFNLKPETTSVIFGYNNFWQLSANLDYFARHVDSPFMHFWYISILLQFDLVFPFVFLALKKLGDKIHKSIPCIITTTLSIIGLIYFYMMSKDQNIMTVYYGTFTRIFSLLFGLTLGFIHSYYKVLIPKILQKNILNSIIFYIYLAVTVASFFLISSTDANFALAMIVISIISCRLIDYSTLIVNKKMTLLDKWIKSLSNISYEIYLVQYPVIFLFQYVNIPDYLKVTCIILLTVVISYILHFCTVNKSKELKIPKYILSGFILLLALFGCYKYVLAEDHTKEMKELEDQLAKNSEMIKKNQDEYAAKLKKEEEEWEALLNDLDSGEDKLKEAVLNMPMVGIGDSVMLGAIPNLQKKFPNGYFDGKVSRTAWEAGKILKELKNKDMLGDPVVIHLGTNGDCPESCKKEIMDSCGARQVFWLNTTNYDYVNKNLLDLASKYDNLHIIDWKEITKGHKEYFVSDGIHLTSAGRTAYTDAIYNYVYEYYLKEYQAKKEEIIKKHEDEKKNKVSFYGNDLLLNAFEKINIDFKDATFNIDKSYDYEMISKALEKDKNDGSLSYNLVLVLDKNVDITINQYKELFNTYKENKIYVVSTNKNIEKLANETFDNVVIIDFYKEINEHREYLMNDGTHLTESGNTALSKLINDTVERSKKEE